MPFKKVNRIGKNTKKAYLLADSLVVRYFPGWLVDLCMKARIVWKKTRMPEKKKSFGSLHPDKTFYVIRLYPPATGFLANYLYVLGYMEYADRKGWIPVVDMEHYETLYSTDQPVNHTRNVWEQYFLQPETEGKRYTLQEVYQSKNVILSNGTMDEWYHGAYDRKEDTFRWQVKQSRRIAFRPNVQDYLNEICGSTLPDPKRTLGCVIRKGGYANGGMHGHSFQYTAEEIVPLLKDRMDRWDCEYLFVKAELNSDIAYMHENFKNVVYTKAYRRDSFTDSITVPEVNGDYLNSNISSFGGLKAFELPAVFLNTLEYLAEIFLLSKCHCMVGSPNNGVGVALIWGAEQIKHYEILHTGVRNEKA